MVRRNSPGASEFAAMWAALPPARRQAMIADLRASLREVSAMATRASGSPLHTPFSGVHSHPHYDGTGGQHAHLHEHDHDANHGDHDHSAIEQAMESADRAKRQRRGAAATGRVMNQARPVSPERQRRIDDAWARAAEGVRQTGRKGQ